MEWRAGKAEGVSGAAAARAEGATGTAGTGETGFFALLVGPVEEVGHDLEDLEFFGVGAVEGQELEEVVCY